MILINAQSVLYDNPKKWGKPHPDTAIERARLTAAAVPNEVQSILEVGAGDGLVIEALRGEGYDPVALDFSKSALKFVEGDKLVLGNAVALPFQSNSFDLIVACEILEHLPISI